MAITTRIQLRAPYLIFLADVEDHTFAKTGLGVAQWCPDKCLGQLRLPGSGVDAGLPEMDIATAAARGAKSIILGVAPVGGQFKDSWVEVLMQAARSGLDVVAGMHKRLAGVPGLAEAAAAGGARLVDVRVPPAGIPIGSGRKRTGRRVLAVGTDCAVGKKYTALALARELQRRSVKSTFRATGQTGIMIAGEGMPIDTVVCDFTAGAAEVLSPDNVADHWDVIEGQGSLFHPAYAGVSLGLLHGSQPDAIVVCHEAGRTAHSGFPDFPLPSLRECIELNLRLAARTNPAVRCIGVSVNTQPLAPSDRAAWLQQAARDTGLPCVDPLVEGPGALVDELLDGSKPARQAAR
ncbi:MAG TPA: DUF1611 domain-containing protein [Candidatus Binatia bacterium]|nr:DUF1611 domain-containing protein [Candidatus Binatia bacterium]